MSLGLSGVLYTMLFGEYNHYIFISYHLQVSDIKGVYIISAYYTLLVM